MKVPVRNPGVVRPRSLASMQARKFHPGQFYRIQNLESGAPVVEDTSLAAEALALTGAWVDREQGLISLITLEMGTSSKLCALWEPGQEIVHDDAFALDDRPQPGAVAFKMAPRAISASAHDIHDPKP